MYPFTGTVHTLQPNTSVTINLAKEGVPSDAYRVIVYATIESGYNSRTPETTELEVSTTTFNGIIKRKLFCHVYDQGSLSYNSENISLPVAVGHTLNVIALLNGPGGNDNFSGSVQIVSYSK